MATPSNLVNSAELRVRLVCEELPSRGFEKCDGLQDIRVDLQTKKGHEAGLTESPSSIAWETKLVVKTDAAGVTDFSGPAVHGKRGERFFYLSWSGESAGRRAMFRRAKIHLRDLTAAQIAKAGKTGQMLEARIHAVAKDGGPACASVPILGGGWSVVRAPAGKASDH